MLLFTGDYSDTYDEPCVTYNGAEVCQPCPAGTYSANKYATFCEACPAGDYCKISLPVVLYLPD
jgi:hypothetical protein